MNYYVKIQELIESFGFKVVSKDFQRPWGGFLVIDENQAQNFSNHFFKGINIEDLKSNFQNINNDKYKGPI